MDEFEDAATDVACLLYMAGIAGDDTSKNHIPQALMDTVMYSTRGEFTQVIYAMARYSQPNWMQDTVEADRIKAIIDKSGDYRIAQKSASRRFDQLAESLEIATASEAVEFARHGYRDVLRKRFQVAFQGWISAQNDQAEFIETICESPIEKLLASALAGRGLPLGLELIPDDLLLQAAVDCKHLIVAQKHLAPYSHGTSKLYRVDFGVLSADRKLQLVIECDGHPFHERTPEQAQKDKSRDRDILRATGAPVLRFTGKEIVASPADCAAEVEAHLETGPLALS